MSVSLSSAVRIAVIAGAMSLLGACATTSQFNSQVQAFHKLSAPAGETFRIVPSDPAKVGSLEFESYANLVRGELVKMGYKPVNAGNAADIDVKMDYAISEPVEKVATRPGMGSAYLGYGNGWYNGWYGGGRYYYSPYGYWGNPWGYDAMFGQDEIYSFTVYNRKLSMSMVRAGSADELYNGKVESVGSDNRMPEIMPYMVQAMFDGFPGPSGATRKVRIEIPRGK